MVTVEHIAALPKSEKITYIKTSGEKVYVGTCKGNIYLVRRKVEVVEDTTWRVATLGD